VVNVGQLERILKSLTKDWDVQRIIDDFRFENPDVLIAMHPHRRLLELALYRRVYEIAQKRDTIENYYADGYVSFNINDLCEDVVTMLKVYCRDRIGGGSR